MAINAFFAGIMCFGVDTRKISTVAGGIGEICMASEAEIPAGINWERFWVVRMVNGRSVTILALNYCMG
jgi:hypothetical protein